MKTLIAVPCMDTVPVGFAESILNLRKPEGTKVCFKADSLVYDSRNLLSLTAIDNGFDRVMWFDSDMIIPPDAMTALYRHLDDGLDMVTGLYVCRKMPVKPVLYQNLKEPERGEDGKLRSQLQAMDEYPQNDLFRVDACGFGCVMTSVSLLKRVWDEFGPAFAPLSWAGEDISFCWRVKQLGVPIWCDSRISCGHVGKFIYHDGLIRR